MVNSNFSQKNIFVESSKFKNQKIPISDFQSQFFMSKIIRIFLFFFFIEEYQLRGMFFVIAIFWLLNLECTLIYQKSFFMKSAIYHSIKLPFDVEVNKNSKMVSSVHYMWYVSMWGKGRQHNSIIMPYYLCTGWRKKIEPI